MNRKAKGTRREYQTMRLLEQAGYRCTRAAASLGCWDVIAIGATDVVLCQVKANYPPGKQELARMSHFPTPATHVRKAIYVWHNHDPDPEVTYIS